MNEDFKQAFAIVFLSLLVFFALVGIMVANGAMIR